MEWAVSFPWRNLSRKEQADQVRTVPRGASEGTSNREPDLDRGSVGPQQGGSALALKYRDIAAEKTTHERIAEARKLARAWKPKE